MQKEQMKSNGIERASVRDLLERAVCWEKKCNESTSLTKRQTISAKKLSIDLTSCVNEHVLISFLLGSNFSVVFRICQAEIDHISCAAMNFRTKSELLC